MPFTLDDILPKEISDEEASHLADIFMELALAIESHYYDQIRRQSKTLLEGTLSEAPEEPF